MNCKQGDLAVIVRSVAGNEGKIVRCVRLVFGDGLLGSGPRWVTDPPLPSLLSKVAFPPLDENMRAIRGQDGEDEMLRIAGRRVGVPESA